MCLNLRMCLDFRHDKKRDFHQKYMDERGFWKTEMEIRLDFISNNCGFAEVLNFSTVDSFFPYVF